MNMKLKKSYPWHLWMISFFMLFMYSMGIYDFFMMLSHNLAYYMSHGYDSTVVAYFTNYPFYFLIFWISNLVFGFISPILLLLKNKFASTAALISFSSDIILLVFTFLFRNRLNVLGISTAVFDVFILVITFGLYVYAKYMSSSRQGQ